MDIRTEIAAIVQKKLKGGPAIEDDAKLTALDIDSLDVVEIMFEIEDRFRIRLPQNSKAMQDATVRDLVAWVGDEVAKKAEA